MEIIHGGNAGGNTGGGGKKRGKKPERRKRTPLEIVRDRREITRLRLRFHLWTQADIAQTINDKHYNDRAPDAEGKEPPLVSQVQVSKELTALYARLDAEAINDVLTLRRIRIAEYRELEGYCYERYEATIGEHTKTTTKEGADTVTREELSGESGYLRLAELCKSKITELEGIAPPRKVAPTNPDGTKPYDAFSESEEIKRLAKIFEEIGKNKGAEKVADYGGK